MWKDRLEYYNERLCILMVSIFMIQGQENFLFINKFDVMTYSNTAFLSFIIAMNNSSLWAVDIHEENIDVKRVGQRKKLEGGGGDRERWKIPVLIVECELPTIKLHFLDLRQS